jgi:hypothetical protein
MPLSRAATLLVDEAAVLALRLSRGIPAKQRAPENVAATHTARARARSMLATPPDTARRSSGAFVRTWDPAPAELPVSGRSTPDDPSKP